MEIELWTKIQVPNMLIYRKLQSAVAKKVVRMGPNGAWCEASLSMPYTVVYMILLNSRNHSWWFLVSRFSYYSRVYKFRDFVFDEGTTTTKFLVS